MLSLAHLEKSRQRPKWSILNSFATLPPVRINIGRYVAMAIPRILLVDDDAAVLTMLQEALERDGFEVVAATSVAGALRRIATEQFDVLLSDLHMPNAGDGFTVVSAM